MKRQRKQTGVMMITVLFVSVILVMFASAVLITVLQHYTSTQSYFQNQFALKMAETGVSYAMSRLENCPDWNGCSPPATGTTGSDYSFLPTTGELAVYEHCVEDRYGCVEGRMNVRNQVGYFDMYFRKPPADSGMVFFKSNSEAGTIPDTIVLCENNSVAAGSDGNSRTAKSSDLVDIAGKNIPGNAILIVCRGRVGRITRTVECCFRFAPNQNFDSVVIGRGNLNITLCGNRDKTSPDDSEFDMISLLDATGGKESIMRSTGDIKMNISPLTMLENNSRITNTHSNDYLHIDPSSKGNAEKQVSFTPPPTAGYDKFDDFAAGQLKHMPRLKKSSVIPDLSTIQHSLNGGTYVISALTPEDAATYPALSAVDPQFYEKYPRVTYYPDDIKDNVIGRGIVSSTTPQDKTGEFATNIGPNDGTGSMSWDYKNRMLTLNESYQVNKVNNLESIIFRSRDYERLSLQIGPSEGTNTEEIFLVNNQEGGSIIVNGQLAGTGGIISSGDVEMEAESQLNSDVNNGISIYADGNVTVNQIYEEPYIEDNDDSSATDDLYDIKLRVASKIKDPGNNTFEYKPSGEYGASVESMIEKYAEDAKGVVVPATKLDPDELSVASPYMLPDGYYQVVVDVPFLGTIDPFGGRWPIDGGGNGALAFYNGTLPSFVKVKLLYSKDAAGPQSEVPLMSRNDLADLFLNPTEVEDEYDSRGRKINRRDSIFRGLIYTCKDFKVNSEQYGFQLQGGLVAYGRDTETDAPNGSNGEININAKDCSFTYESKYLSFLEKLGDSSMDPVYWVNY